ncbi:MAG: molybdenum cofactor guanylyltransferase [Terriglobales bacterium]
MAHVAAFVLAGGKSSRMGKDKAFLELDGRTLLERALELARSVSGEVSVVGPRAKFAGHGYGPIIEDVFPNCGPLAGIHAALSASRSALNFILALDTPFLDARFVCYLIEQAAAGGTMVTAPRTGGQVQPLCAVYRREFAEVAEKALREGRLKIESLLALVTTRELDDSELAKMDFDARMFENLNTPADWERARAGAASPEPPVPRRKPPA